MRVLIVGSDDTFAIEKYYLKYFKEFGTVTELFPAQTLFYNYYRNSILNRVLLKANISLIYDHINHEFKKYVENFKPHVIWIFKGMELSPSSLAWSKKRGIKLVNFNPDNPFIFSGKGSGNKNITRSVSLYDLHLTYNKSVQELIKAKYNLRTIYLPFGFDVSDDVFNNLKSEKEDLKIAFVGNPDIHRALFLNQLAGKGCLIDVYGIEWKRFVNVNNITVRGLVSGNNFWKALRKYRIQLNLMRPHNLNSHNMRSFEIPGIGGIMLAPDTPEHRSFFQVDKEVFLFKNLDNSLEQINYLLKLTLSEANGIREQARQKSLDAGYTYKHRSRQVLEVLKTLHK